MSYTNARDLLSEAKFFEAYSRFDSVKNRYETWQEAVHRVMEMHRTRLASVMTDELANILNEIEKAYANKEVLGAQRALQFGGEQLLKHQARLFNCSASYCDRPSFFGESFYLMLCGCGVGFSVQRHHVAKLPDIAARTKSTKEFIVPDSIEGWAAAVDILLSSFFVGGGKHPEYEGRKVYFNLEQIRPKGAFISGGFKAPGPESLRKALDNIETLIKNELAAGRTSLRPIVAYDIVMYIADAVISGGVRRSATICLFSFDDEEMLNAKTGNWFVTNPQRGRSNNSCVLVRSETTLEQLQHIMKSVKDVGEPGFIFSDDVEALFNPCVEIGMYGYDDDGISGFQFCNLVEIAGGKSISPEIFYYQCYIASALATIQAHYTDFKFVSESTKKITDREALIGVSVTGWMNNPEVLFNEEVMTRGAQIVKDTNKHIAALIGINQAARTTCVKPSGNASVLLGCASGIHGEHSPLFIRHAQFNKDTEIAKLFMSEFPAMCEDSVWNRERDIVIAFPVTTPEHSIYKSDLLGVKQLEFVKKAQDVWIEQGTNHDLCIKPWLRHNVSNTITVPQDGWDEVTEYIFKNRQSFCGISFLSAAGDRAYPQAPFTEVFTHEQIVAKYGEIALFASGLIERGLKAFNNDLWTACNTALGYGEKLTLDHKDAEKQEFVRSFKKFAKNFIGSSLTEEDHRNFKNLLNAIEDFEDYADELRGKSDALEQAIEVLENQLLIEPDNVALYSTKTLLNAQVFDLDREIEDSMYKVVEARRDLAQTSVHLAKLSSYDECANCLKDVYNLHKWWKIQQYNLDLDWTAHLHAKEYIDINTTGAQACSGGQCEINF